MCVCVCVSVSGVISTGGAERRRRIQGMNICLERRNLASKQEATLELGNGPA